MGGLLGGIDVGGATDALGLTSSSSSSTALSAFSGKGNKTNVAALFGNPVFLQAIFALSEAGQNPFDVLGEFFTNKKGTKGGTPGQYLKVGGSQYLDLGALSTKLPEYLGQAETAKIKAQGATYDKLKGTPQFENIFNEANGKFSPQFDAEVSKAYGQLGNFALGGGVASGFLDDPNKQANILAPIGVQLAQYKQQVKKDAESQALGYSGAGYIPGGSPAGLLGAGNAGSYYQPLFAAGGLYQGNNQFNSQLGFAASAQNQSEAPLGSKGFVTQFLGS